jgi:hypothetical protein
MPFSADAFLDVFAAYNQALWPFAATLWLLTAGVFAAFLSGTRMRAPLPRIVLTGHWLWAGVMYHAVFFTAINPAAWLFATLFFAQGVLLARAWASDATTEVRPRSVRHAVSAGLIVYSLVYPLLTWADGFAYPRMPTFGVPCPTAILTIGFLIAVSTRSLLLSAVPIIWSVVGGSAAWLFGVHADLALPVAGVMLAVDLLRRRSHVMKKPSHVVSSAVLVAMLALVPASRAFAQAAQHDHEQQTQQGAAAGGMKMGAGMMDEMAAKKKANTERIAALMAQVKSSTGDAKVAAMADVINILLEERAAMGEHCATMMSMMKK